MKLQKLLLIVAEVITETEHKLENIFEQEQKCSPDFITSSVHIFQRGYKVINNTDKYNYHNHSPGSLEQPLTHSQLELYYLHRSRVDEFDGSQVNEMSR